MGFRPVLWQQMKWGCCKSRRQMQMVAPALMLATDLVKYQMVVVQDVVVVLILSLAGRTKTTAAW